MMACGIVDKAILAWLATSWVATSHWFLLQVCYSSIFLNFFLVTCFGFKVKITMVRKNIIIRIRSGCKVLQLSLHLLLHVICPMFRIRRAIKAVRQKMAAAKKATTASVWMGNTKVHKIVGKALKAMNCVKRRRLLRATVWIHFEWNGFEQQYQQQQHVQQ